MTPNTENAVFIICVLLLVAWANWWAYWDEKDRD